MLSFGKLKRSMGATWASHPSLGGRERIEKTGDKLQDMSFTMLLRSDAGISAREKIDLLESYVEDGKCDNFILGSYLITGYPWVVTAVSAAYNMILDGGAILSASVDVTLKQYF